MTDAEKIARLEATIIDMDAAAERGIRRNIRAGSALRLVVDLAHIGLNYSNDYSKGRANSIAFYTS